MKILGTTYSDENYYIIINAYDRLFTSLSTEQKYRIFKDYNINIYRDYEAARQTTLRSWLKLSAILQQSLHSLIFNKPVPYTQIDYPRFKKLIQLYKTKPRLPGLPTSHSINVYLCNLRRGYTNTFPLTYLMDISQKFRITLDDLVR